MQVNSYTYLMRVPHFVEDSPMGEEHHPAGQ
jgi:hypothetical protein